MARIFLWLLLFVGTAAAASDRWGGSAAWASDYRLRGVSQSDNSNALQLELHFAEPSGLLAGIWASSLQLYSKDSATTQLSAFLGYRWSLGSSWNTRLVVAHYAHPWDALASRYDYDELEMGAAWRDRIFVTATFSPNFSVASPLSRAWNRSAISYDATIRIPFKGGLSGTAGLGYSDLHDIVGTGYWYGSTGIAFDLPRVHFDLSWIQTSSAAGRIYYGDIADDRWSGTVMWTF